MPGIKQQARILVVDDDPACVQALERLLGEAGYSHVSSTTESSQVMSLCARNRVDLMLLDLQMPSPDGFELVSLLRPWIEGRSLPIVICSENESSEDRERLLAAGAKDFVGKPCERMEVLPRVRNLLETHFLRIDLRRKNLSLAQELSEHERDVHDARLEALERLALAAEYRDDETGGHSRRIGRTCALMARAMGMAEQEVELIGLAAPLHDVGKIAVPDRVLSKQGALTPEEFEVMKTHVGAGALILAGSRSPLFQMAEQIVLTHHEWWDGSGYPAGLAGEQIPVVGRIVAIADVFDSLTQDRPYKSAMTVPDAVVEMSRLSGTQFDPAAVDAFERLDHGVLVGAVEPVEALV